LFAILGSFVVEGEVLAGWAFLDCWTFLSGWAGVSLAANRVPEKVHNQTPAIKKLSQRNFIKFPPEALSGYCLSGLIIQEFKKITMKKTVSCRRFQGEISSSHHKFLSFQKNTSFDKIWLLYLYINKKSRLMPLVMASPGVDLGEALPWAKLGGFHKLHWGLLRRHALGVSPQIRMSPKGVEVENNVDVTFSDTFNALKFFSWVTMKA
jgi:hypothetical protein